MSDRLDVSPDPRLHDYVEECSKNARNRRARGLPPPPLPWTESDEVLVGDHLFDDEWLDSFNAARVSMGLRPLSPQGRPDCRLHSYDYCPRHHDPCPYGLKKEPRADWGFWSAMGLCVLVIVVMVARMPDPWLWDGAAFLLWYVAMLGLAIAPIAAFLYGWWPYARP